MTRLLHWSLLVKYNPFALFSILLLSLILHGVVTHCHMSWEMEVGIPKNLLLLPFFSFFLRLVYLADQVLVMSHEISSSH